MLNLFQNLSRKIIGLNIGADFIVVIKARRKGTKIYIEDLVFRKFSSEIALAGDYQSRISEIIQEAVSPKEIKKSKFYVLIPSSKFCIRLIDMPLIPQAEIPAAVKAKVRKFVAPELDKIFYSYKLLGEFQEKGAKKLEAVFVAIQKDTLQNYLNVFNRLGINVALLAPSCFGLLNLLSTANLDNQAESRMFIKIESRETDITVYQGSKFILTRNIPFGVKNFTDILQQQTHKVAQTIEDLNLAWRREKEISEKSGSDQQLDKTLQLLDSEAKILSKEVELTINYYYQVSHGRKIDRCIVLGEGSQITDLVEILGKPSGVVLDFLKIPTNVEVNKNKSADFSRDFAIYATAVGILFSKKDDINLATELVSLKKGQFFRFTKLNIFIASIATLALAIFILLKGTELYFKNRISYFKSQQEKLKDKKIKLVDIKRQLDKLEFKKNLYLNLKQNIPDYSYVLNKIFESIAGKDLALTSITISGQENKEKSKDIFEAVTFIIEGSALNPERSRLDITQTVLDLESSGIFENISVSTKTDTGNLNIASLAKQSDSQSGVLNFTIKGNIKFRKLP